MNFTPEFYLSIILALGSGVGAYFAMYTAIRADLATLHERTQNTKELADLAHARIDRMMQK